MRLLQITMMLPTASQNDAETATDNVVELIRMIEKETSDMNINIYYHYIAFLSTACVCHLP